MPQQAVRVSLGLPASDGEKCPAGAGPLGHVQRFSLYSGPRSSRGRGAREGQMLLGDVQGALRTTVRASW
eukprot:CAMPEP_0176259528 /NCGR_PEP_ID=MMETSP0121_2-20121125/39117_1 /TAXON_ID=160619 /ORGANISM="Kryptoperidinium foliaceum, Strain CCMP 1326" /LENGTH=69 /DNA_ID=CAMNT_0017599417 /DNA_START=171 /DNA_END=377 /DNA_ORIENTATION=+